MEEVPRARAGTIGARSSQLIQAPKIGADRQEIGELVKSDPI